VSDYDCLLSTREFGWFYSPNPSAVPACTSEGRYGPGNPRWDCHTNHYYSMHSNGANWLLADGSVRFISYNAQPLVSAGLATATGGEVFDMP
jgi:prepilin-type processing-associated H-X9-DG protein